MGTKVNRLLLTVLLFAAGLSSCTKTVDVQAQINAQLVKDNQLITTYLKNNNITASVIDSAGVSTGIYYKIDTAGTGTGLFTSSTQVTVGWVAWQIKPDATLSTVIQQTDTFHPSFILGETIRGWQFGLEDTKMSVGGIITLYVPSHYAYGPFAQASLGLPANAVLVFHITLYNITN
jgi:FKBP-type peptidyl-prolyl cis-trans isomerase FkpA